MEPDPGKIDISLGRCARLLPNHMQDVNRVPKPGDIEDSVLAFDADADLTDTGATIRIGFQPLGGPTYKILYIAQWP